MEEKEKVHELLRHFSTAMLITHSMEGHHNARPMAIARLEPNCDVWFFCHRSSAVAQEVENDPQALLVFEQEERNRFVSLIGSAKLDFNRDRMHSFWQEKFKTWVPKGVEDPDLVLICIKAEVCEYWDQLGTSGVKYVLAKAHLAGDSEAAEAELHGRVLMK